MARYTGPKLELLVNLAKQYSEMTKRKKKLPTWTTRDAKKEEKSEYAIQLMEKQKAKYSYGILKQFRGLFKSISY
jgi:small subunit ribosomal protein S4